LTPYHRSDRGGLFCVSAKLRQGHDEVVSVIRSLKQHIPLGWKARAAYVLSRPDPVTWEDLRGKHKAIITLAADYPNLGDIAITQAQARFVKACLPGYEIVDFPCAATYTQIKALKRVCTPADVVTIIGGGNMGDLYSSLEDARRFIIRQFPRNRIISFPQSMDLSDTPAGQRELARSQRAYGRHPNLYLFAREPVSFEMMQRHFPGTPVRLVPDIALSLPLHTEETQRKGVLVCIRNDKESALGPIRRAELLGQLTASIVEAEVTDTVLSRTGRLSLDERDKELEALVLRFRHAEAVVTDRLHGMIMAAISGTPCVVLRNANHKIVGTYRTWLAENRTIALLEDYSAAAVLAALKQVRAQAGKVCVDLGLSRAFEPLRLAVTGVLS
jgi:pyruvyl transferase EpsI